MARVKRGNIARKRRNKILNLAKGFRGGNKNLFRFTFNPHLQAPDSFRNHMGLQSCGSVHLEVHKNIKKSLRVGIGSSQTSHILP